MSSTIKRVCYAHLLTSLAGSLAVAAILIFVAEQAVDAGLAIFLVVLLLGGVALINAKLETSERINRADSMKALLTGALIGAGSLGVAYGYTVIAWRITTAQLDQRSTSSEGFVKDLIDFAGEAFLPFLIFTLAEILGLVVIFTGYCVGTFRFAVQRSSRQLKVLTHKTHIRQATALAVVLNFLVGVATIFVVAAVHFAPAVLAAFIGALLVNLVVVNIAFRANTYPPI